MPQGDNSGLLDLAEGVMAKTFFASTTQFAKHTHSHRYRQFFYNYKHRSSEMVVLPTL